jgi:hypothetical protein
VIPLWPGDGTRADDPAKNLVESMPDKGDNILRIQNVTKPTLHLWKPTKQNGGAVINPSAPVQGRLQGPPAKSNFLVVSSKFSCAEARIGE